MLHAIDEGKIWSIDKFKGKSAIFFKGWDGYFFFPPNSLSFQWVDSLWEGKMYWNVEMSVPNM